MHAFDAEKLLEAVSRSAPAAAGCPNRSTSYGEGTLLTPSIRLVRPLGDGGMASVWIAKHENLGINVAVKLLAEGMLDHPVIHKRFLEEGPAAARIKSPHVVQI